MKKKIIFIGVFLLLGSNYACNNIEKEADNTEYQVNEEEIIELETSTEEVSNSSIEMEEDMNELSQNVDSLLTDI